MSTKIDLNVNFKNFKKENVKLLLIYYLLYLLAIKTTRIK